MRRYRHVVRGVLTALLVLGAVAPAGLLATRTTQVAPAPTLSTAGTTPVTPTTWLAAPPLPIALNGVAATTGSDGTLYAVGVWNGNSGAQSTLFAFTPGADSAWRTVAPLPAVRADSAATTGSDGTLYVIGGGDGTLTPQSTVYAFKPGADTAGEPSPLCPLRAQS